jgi:CheY-like chemotaxis protein
MAKSILLIDDEEKFAVMLQELLQAHGYEADYCLNPEDAVARLRREDFELVITDYKMPQMDGAQFLEQARRINPDLPVIMISGLMNMPELIKVANIGVTLVLEKPFKTEDLLEQVARFVRTAPVDKAGSDAMDRVAAEVRFPAGPVQVTYPAPARFLSDASNENKRFLESLWQRANTCRHLPFYAQRGAEVRLVACEIMEWTGQDPNADVVRIDLIDTGTDFTRSWVLETDPFPGVLLVDMRTTSWNAESARLLSDWINFVESCGRDLSLTRLLYVLLTGSAFDPAVLNLEEGHGELLSSDCPALLSLRERVPDTATYLTRLLDAGQRQQLGRANLLRLLHYAWPGGYQELNSCIDALKGRLKDGASVAEDELVKLVAERSEDASSLKGSLDLEGFLKRRQRDYILMHREPGEEISDTLRRLGINDSAVDTEGLSCDGALIYPDLLAGGGH